MGDILDASVQAPIPAENISGIGVAGPPAEPPEEEVTEAAPEEVTEAAPEEVAEAAPEEASSIQRETAEYSEEYLGRNVDIEA